MSDDEPKGAPDWIVTFSDIISLLVTFFVLMLTWSTLESDKFERAAGALQGGLGALRVDKQQEVAVKQEFARRDRSETEGMLTRADQEPVDTALRDLGLRLKKRLGETVDTELLLKRRAIRVTPSDCFEAGSATLTPALRCALDSIAQAVAGPAAWVRIAGHTDDREPPGRYESRWRLAAARAAAAARRLAADGEIDPRRISVATYADRRPLYPNDLDAVRSGNRRLEVTILPAPAQRE